MRSIHPPHPPAAIVALLVLPLLLTGCVRRVHEAPGLSSDHPWAVGSDMRVEQFEQGEYEVRVFRLDDSRQGDRRYEFLVLEDGYETTRLVLERLEEGGWALLEYRPEGITASRMTWTEEPAYRTVRAEVVRLLRERDDRTGV
ncbi:MAG: hypothetical protein R6W82_10690 [bacterium]